MENQIDMFRHRNSIFRIYLSFCTNEFYRWQRISSISFKINHVVKSLTFWILQIVPKCQSDSPQIGFAKPFLLSFVCWIFFLSRPQEQNHVNDLEFRDHCLSLSSYQPSGQLVLIINLKNEYILNLSCSSLGVRFWIKCHNWRFVSTPHCSQRKKTQHIFWSYWHIKHNLSICLCLSVCLSLSFEKKKKENVKNQIEIFHCKDWVVWINSLFCINEIYKWQGRKVSSYFFQHLSFCLSVYLSVSVSIHISCLGFDKRRSRTLSTPTACKFVADKADVGQAAKFAATAAEGLVKVW